MIENELLKLQAKPAAEQPAADQVKHPEDPKAQRAKVHHMAKLVRPLS